MKAPFFTTGEYEEKTMGRRELRESKGWKTSRMGKVELSILRLAVYELRYDDDVPGKVAINEAVELAKKFGGSEAPAFINGVLGKLAKEADE